MNLNEFDAKRDSTTNNLPAFQKAIESIKTNGGGKIIVPKGNYLLNGPIHLVSNLELHLEEGAHLYFSSNPKHYLPVVKTSWEGTFLYNYSPFIYAYQCSNIAITGKGIIDGEATNTWKHWKQKQNESQLLSRKMNHENTPIEERIFGEGHVPKIENINVKNLNCRKSSGTGIVIQGFPEAKVKDVFYPTLKSTQPTMQLVLSTPKMLY